VPLIEKLEEKKLRYSIRVVTGVLFYNSHIQGQDQAGRIVRKMVGIAEKRHLVAVFVEIALIPDIGGEPAGAQGEAGLPAPGKLFPAFGIPVEVDQFGFAVQKIVANRSAVQADGAQGKADEQGHIEVLIPLGFNDFDRGRFANFKIGAVRVENKFRLQKHRVSKAEPEAELGAEFEVFHAEIEGRVAAADADIGRVFELRLQAAFYTESELRPGSSGAEKKDDYYECLFHTCIQVLMTEKRAARSKRTLGSKNGPGLTNP